MTATKDVSLHHCDDGFVGVLNSRFERAMLAGRWAVWLYRLSHAAYKARIPIVPYLIQMLNGWLHGCEIHYMARIGNHFEIAHPRGVVVGRNVEAGERLKLYTGVVLGVKHTGVPLQPRIGSNVIIYAGAKVLGGITIGDNVAVGANAVVTEDVRPDVFVAGIPARVVGQRDPGTGRRRNRRIGPNPCPPRAATDHALARCATMRAPRPIASTPERQHHLREHP
ncbi:MAG TPA: hypothetical protein VLM89_02920 [Phycisphaerae bacterium]|nr:hypothetical protein [Phycisphaerae bacterium]